MKRTLALLLVLVAIAAGAMVFRARELSLRPMHGDEAIHTFVFKDLWKEHKFIYDPADYHGPTLHFATLPVVWLTGVKDFEHTTEATYRIVPAIFGVALIVMLALVVDGLGMWAVIVAGVLTAISPAMVFFSRYYIQEMLLVCFTFGAIASGWRYVRARSAGAKVLWAVAGGMFVGLMHGTKETWVIAAACAVGGIVMTMLWNLVADGSARGVRENFAGRGLGRNAAMLMLGLVVAGLVGSAILSNGFKNPKAIWQSVETYKGNIKRGAGENAHEHEWSYYLKILADWKGQRGVEWNERIVLGLAGVGAISALWPRRRRKRDAKVAEIAGKMPVPQDSNRPAEADPARIWIDPGLARFLTFYTIGLIAIYSAIRYKTPWCLLSFEHGLILLAGVGAATLIAGIPGWLMRRGGMTWKVGGVVCGVAFGVAIAGGAAQLGSQAYRMNFEPKYLDSWYNPYIYGHPLMKVMDLVKRMEELRRVSPKGQDISVRIVGKDCWPMPWYLRGFPGAFYWAEVPAGLKQPPEGAPRPKPTPAQRLRATGVEVLIVPAEQANELDESMGDEYEVVYYGLRHDVLLCVYIRKDVWDNMLRARGVKQGRDG